jgi:hypothetical protein
MGFCFDLAVDHREVECLPNTVRESLDLLDHSEDVWAMQQVPQNSKVSYFECFCDIIIIITLIIEGGIVQSPIVNFKCIINENK